MGKIGQGSMGEVFKAYDAALNRHVALKTMTASLVSEENLRQRFHREAQSAARLNHPNIVTVFDFGEDRGKIYMAMELLQGKDLRELLNSRTLGDLNWRLDVMDQICDGLAFAHSAEIIHRDLKPGNIHVQQNGNVKIMDFGLARLGASDMTKTGTVMGTPSYMSPEQIRGEKTSTRSDVFSLGVIFYELLSYHRPFNAESMHALLFQVLDRAPEPLIEWAPGVPDPLVAIVNTALSKDPALRYADAAEMRQALTSVTKTIPPTTSVPTEPAVRPKVSRPELSATLGNVEGATALEVRPGATPRPTPATLRGRTSTHVAPTTLIEPRRPTPWILIAAVTLVVGGGVTLVVKRPWQAPIAPATAPSQENELRKQLANSQGELAQRSLDDKAFADAKQRAQQILTLDATNERAKEIFAKAQENLNAIDAAANEARTAFKAGDTSRATQALGTLLALDPRHPVAQELAGQLNSRFRSQAEDARNAMRAAQKEAEKARANGLKPYQDGSALQKDAETRFRGEEFTVAMGKFLEARDAFDRARHAAQAPPVIVVPPSLAPVPNLPSAPPVSLEAPTPLPPRPSVAPVVNEEAAVRQAVADFGRALETKDVALYKTVRPVTSDEEKRLKEAFKAIRSQSVVFSIHSVRVEGDQAVVKLNRKDTIDGKGLPAMEQTLQLQKGPNGWAIRQIQQ